MSESDKYVGFLNYAKKKKWDASLCFYNGNYLAILNPLDDKGVIEASSEMSIGEAIDLCKEQLIKRNKKK